MLPLDIWKHLLNSKENRQQKPLVSFLVVAATTSVSRALHFRPSNSVVFSDLASTQAYLPLLLSYHLVHFVPILFTLAPVLRLQSITSLKNKQTENLLRLGRRMESKVKKMNETFGGTWKKAKERTEAGRTGTCSELGEGVQAARVTVLLLWSSGRTASHAGSTCLL